MKVLQSGSGSHGFRGSESPLQLRLVLFAFLVFCLAANVIARQTPSPASPGAGTTTAQAEAAAPKPAPSTQAPDAAPAPAAEAPEALPREVEEVVRMVQAGVSTEIIRSYIEGGAVAYDLSASAIIRLKEQAVPDELTKAMVKRGAELRAASARQPKRVQNAPRRSEVVYRGLDPESYEYFQHYYLQPRAIAAANERIYSAPGSYYAYGPGPFGFYRSPFRGPYFRTYWGP